MSAINFDYKARDVLGKVHQGTIEAEHREDAAARLRRDGTIELHGRDSVCINTGGEKVFAEEVETAVKSHPAVLDAVVCGRPSARWGSEVVAIVHLRPGAEVSDEELRDTAGAHLARFKLPRVILRRERVVRLVQIVGVQVGDVDEQPYAGPRHQLGQERTLPELLARPVEQRGHVLQRQRHRQRRLGDAHVLHQHVQAVAGTRHRQQMPGLHVPGAHHRHVLADQR